MAFTPQQHIKVEISTGQILSIALPITIALIVPQVNFATNNIFIGMIGNKELGNAGITGVFYLIFAVVGNGLNNSLQSLISRNAGEGSINQIGSLFSQGIRISLQIALVSMVFTLFIAPLILKNFLKPEDIEPVISFLKIRILGLPFLYLFQMCNAFLVGTLNSRYLMIGTMIQALLNILFDYTFMFGHFGMPKMGFNGAAFASVLAEVGGLIVVVLIIFKLQLNKKFQLFKTFRFDKAQTKSIYKIAPPLILQYLISLVTWLVFFLMIEQMYDDRDKAISNIMRNVFGITGIFVWAFGSTSNTMVSNLMGQQKQELVLTAIHKISKWSFIFCLIISIIINTIPGMITRLFSADTDFQTHAIPVIAVVSVAMLCMSIAAVWLNALVGIGKTKLNLLTELIAIIVYLIYNYLIIYTFKLNITWAWSNEIVYWVTIFSVSYLFIKKKNWMEKNE